MTNDGNHWILCQLTRSTKLNHGQRTDVLFAATSDRLAPRASSPKQSWRAANSCFALIGARQCGVLMDNVLTWSDGVRSSDCCHLSLLNTQQLTLLVMRGMNSVNVHRE